MVKNTVIVPVGSKGGFVLKKAPPASDREAYVKEGVACYQDYLRGLLDVTDNLVQGKAVPPPHVARHDGDDPYLVVAADKGTATFSDYANAISAEYGHWLGDAFASGGSAGYDHKGMGITARGAWESVKRHFREMGIDTQTTEFTCAGIGDMSGDVFGNGMLLSKHIRLVAAFDHRHIFVDPAPDSATSFAERERVFALPRSSWAGLQRAFDLGRRRHLVARREVDPGVAAGAGRARYNCAACDTDRADRGDTASAPVDLLYNGGIGTYVKASSENHADVGDRANDAVRINGADLRCKVIGEGGNLGLTQRGRVEAALKGVRLYTDAIDNSAGVDTSDHEVNIKILLGRPWLKDVSDARAAQRAAGDNDRRRRASGAAKTTTSRRRRCRSASYTARKLLEQQQRFIRFLEKEGRLNRALEFLPDDETIAERRAAGPGVDRPGARRVAGLLEDVAVRRAAGLGHAAKILGRRSACRLLSQRLLTQFAHDIERHPLRREIIATWCSTR